MQTDKSLTDLAMLFAGHAIFTVDNGGEGSAHKRFTFCVQRRAFKQRDGSEQVRFFLKMLTGPDNSKDYSYLGMYDDQDIIFRQTAKSPKNQDTAFKAANWALWVLGHGGQAPGKTSIIREGYCLRCGRLLTTPESVLSGYGPECIKRVGGEEKEERGSGEVQGEVGNE